MQRNIYYEDELSTTCIDNYFQYSYVNFLTESNSYFLSGHFDKFKERM